MDWHDLAYFVCLVEQQTLTACAEQLGVQHSTVSRRIERREVRRDDSGRVEVESIFQLYGQHGPEL